jgi:hypothetical protein
MIECQPCVYILANSRHGTLYIGMTSNLPADCISTGTARVTFSRPTTVPIGWFIST